MHILRSYAGLPRPVYVLFVANVVNRMGDFVKMFLTLYLTQVLALPEEDAGTFVMLSAGGATLGGLLGGRMSDAFGRRRVLMFFFLLSGLIIGSCGFLPPTMLIAWLLIPASMCIGGVRPVLNSVVADLTDREGRLKAFSLLYLGVNIGVAVGPMIAGFLFARYLSWIFWGDAFTTFGALLLILLFVPETRPSAVGPGPASAHAPGLTSPPAAAHAPPEAEKPDYRPLWQVLKGRPVLLLFGPLMFFSHLVYAQHAFTIPLQLSRLFGEGGAKKFGMVMSVNAIVVLAATTLVLHFSRRRKPLSNMGIAGLLFAVGFGMLSAVKTFPLFLVSVGIWSVGEILMVTNAGVFIANHTPENYRGRFNGLLSLILGLGLTLAPFVSGRLVGPLGIELFWLCIGLFAAFTAILFFLLARFDRPKFDRSTAAP